MEGRAMIPLQWQVLSDGYTEAPEAIAIQGGSWFKKLRFHATAFLLRHPTEGYLLVDSGYSQRFHTETHSFPAKLYAWITHVTLTEPQGVVGCLAKLGIAPTDIRHLILTHFHADHTGGLRDFPHSRVYCSELAWNACRGLYGFHAVRQGILPGLLPEDLAERLTFVDEGSDLLGDGSVKVLALPGHAPGQIGLHFHAQENRDVLLAADACWLSDAFRHNQMPHLLTRALHDWPRYHGTLQRLHDLHRAEPRLRIVPSHCPETAALIQA